MKTESLNKREDVLEALDRQIEYFDKNHFIRAKKISVRAYTGALCSWINILTDRKCGGHANRTLRGELKKRLKFILKENKKLVPFDECRWAYMAAYPRRVMCYGFIERVVGKVKRVCQLSVL